MMRQYGLNGNITKIFKGRKPKWTSKYDLKYYNLLRSIKIKGMENIAIYIAKINGIDEFL